ncbi:nitrate/sulfonate/bicarbonate ABC transporter ATP-binding protein [Paracoccus zhejiangensis]|uniref:Nitrate/sulfonate/bicarbonate ABC transporter ATP-binding protein n=1 Tax=Paracoccus zhejiangensis TaxID=1077935 RepID=A0A2H5F0D9_9RHOB|nr:ABC transporter ATP-binding protein [Paracoccus zhejiangensis]AUH65018.1 nitrate/sulfonate/bicarbonate ABC transporter ATP-binding protein [Paracoccus zhejiangensis]
MPADPPPPDILCRGLSKVFSGGVEVLSPLDIALAAGQTTALVGPSGCGKSTLLRLIAGLEDPSAGDILIGGETPDHMRRQAAISVAFQDPSLLPWRSLRGNIALGRKLARLPADPALVDRLIRLVGLAGFEAIRPAALSGGMRQRAAIARALASAPRLLLLDEPFGAVDELTRRQLALDLPPLWQERGTSTLLVTHSVSEAVFLADRILVLSPRPARIVADIAVPLSHPRRSDLADSAGFHDLAAEVSAALARGVAA